MKDFSAVVSADLSRGAERKPIPVVNALDSETLDTFFQEYLTRAVHPTSPEVRPAPGCDGPGHGGVCGCASANASAHTFQGVLALRSSAEDWAVNLDDEEFEAELDAELKELEAELEAELVLAQRGAKPRVAGWVVTSLSLRGASARDADLWPWAPGAGRGELRAALAVECGLGRARVAEVLKAALARCSIGRGGAGEAEGGAERLFTARRVHELREIHSLLQPRPKLKQNKVPRAGRWTAAPRTGRAYYSKQGLLHQEYEGPIVECSPTCACAEKGCDNRVVQSGLTADLRVVRTERTGWGVFTTKALRAGEFVVEYAGALLSEEEAAAVDHSNDFLFTISEQWTLDPTERGGVGAFLNHSCAPNCIMQRVHIEHREPQLPRMALFAEVASHAR